MSTPTPFKSLAEIANELPSVTDKSMFWVSFEYWNKQIGTWSSYAKNPDEFIADLLERQGDRIVKFLELQQHAGNWPETHNPKIDVARYNRMLREEQRYDKTAGMTFGLERDLQVALRKNIAQLEAGLQVIDGGKERVTEVGRIDITATDRNGKVVVIELKAGRAFLSAIGQISAYMSVIAKTDKKDIRGILIAANFSRQARIAAQAIPNLELRKYGFQFLFQGVK